MKQKQRLTVDDRINLQACIAKNISQSETCKIIKKNRSTVYRELKNYSNIRDSIHSCHHCQKKDFCEENGVVTVNMPKNQPCFVPIFCHFLCKYPFVCNNCESKCLNLN